MAGIAWTPSLSVLCSGSNCFNETFFLPRCIYQVALSTPLLVEDNGRNIKNQKLNIKNDEALRAII